MIHLAVWFAVTPLKKVAPNWMVYLLERVLSEVAIYHERVKTLLKALSLGTKYGKDYRRSLQGTICGFHVSRIEKTAEHLIG
jgi:hypothetical protein